MSGASPGNTRTSRIVPEENVQAPAKQDTHLAAAIARHPFQNLLFLTGLSRLRADLHPLKEDLPGFRLFKPRWTQETFQTL